MLRKGNFEVEACKSIIHDYYVYISAACLLPHHDTATPLPKRHRLSSSTTFQDIPYAADANASDLIYEQELLISLT